MILYSSYIQTHPKICYSSLNATRVVYFLANTTNVWPASRFEFDMPAVHSTLRASKISVHLLVLKLLIEC